MGGDMSIGWGMDWAWGLPLIVLTVIFHAYGLGFIRGKVASALSGVGRLRNPSVALFPILGATALAATVLHAFESAMWAGAYRALGALQNSKSAMLYSLNAMTSYGHESLHLSPRWEMMGALEALNGWILFGLTTGFLFALVHGMWPPINGVVKPDEVHQ
jgi:hypothetical protein